MNTSLSIFTISIGIVSFSIADDEFAYAHLETGYKDKNRGLILHPIAEKTDGQLKLTGFEVKDTEGKTIQIIPHDYIPHRNPLTFVDFDFDGNLDIMLESDQSSVPNMYYVFWRYDSKTKKFVKDERLDGIDSVDEESEELKGYGRSGSTYSSATYKWLEGKLTPLRTESTMQDKEGMISVEYCFYEKGVLKKRVTAPGDPRYSRQGDTPYNVVVERFDESGSSLGKTVEVRHERRD